MNKNKYLKCPVVWFTVLEAAKTRKDKLRIRLAKKKLLELGIRVCYCKRKML